MKQEYLWTEIYRPKTVAECILPPDLKKMFQAFVDQGQLVNFLFSGTSGIGKTSVAMAILEEMKSDYVLINSSMKGDIDTLRTEISAYASTVSFNGGRKFVILDEADYLTAKTQPALRNFMEEFSKGCGFILTCNYKNRIIEPLQSRMACVDFVLKKADRPRMAKEFFERVKEILSKENIAYDEKVVIAIIKKMFPDFRRILNELQRYSITGSIDSGLLAEVESITSLKTLVGLMKEKKFFEVRQWVSDNNFNDAGIFRAFYDVAFDYFDPKFVPDLILIIAEYQHKATASVDQEINTTAFLVETMLRAQWRG